MATREAACHCGQLRLEVTGDPFAVSICHCLACKGFPPPTESGYDSRRHAWLAVPDTIERQDGQ